MLFAAIRSPSASCSSCEITSTELCALHRGTEDCGGAKAVHGGETDETGVLCAGDESTIGNNTSETTCRGPMRTPYRLMQLLIILMTNGLLNFIIIPRFTNLDEQLDFEQPQQPSTSFSPSQILLAWLMLFTTPPTQALFLICI